jgi:tetratricopeptide (TPR) repeat protein
MPVPAHISEEEIQQLQRTVEMFEAITQAQPDDYQSLEILKEAYTNLGRKEDALRVSLKLVEAYEKQGQVFKAILECEGILQDHPDQADIRKRLTTLEDKAKLAVGEAVPSPAPVPEPKPLKSAPPSPSAPGPALSLVQQAEEGDRALADLLIAEKLATPQALQPLLQQLKSMRQSAHPGKGQPLSLVQLVINEQFAKQEDVLTLLLNKSMLPFLPLANYDVERETASLLSLEMCWQFCIVPFDQISRCLLVATANPFQAAAKRTVETALRVNLFWYVAAPADIVNTLRRAHRIEGATKPTT